MESCFLCLELNNEFLERIQIDSVEWKELNVQYVIEKHFWPIDTLQTSSSSWLCYICWQELYTFHKFFKRVEKSQVRLHSTAKEDDTLWVNNDGKMEDLKPTIEKVNCKENKYESEFLHNSFLNNEIVNEIDTNIKEELKIEEASVVEENFPRKRTMRFCQAKIRNNISVDPLVEKQTKRKKSCNAKRKYLKLTKIKYNKPAVNTNENTKTNEMKSELQQDGDSIQNNKSDENDNCSGTDSNYEPIINLQKDTEKILKQNENDKFLADNFKITCSLCQIHTETFHDLCHHFKSVHKHNGFAICCNKKFYRRSYLVEHLRQHADPNYFKCTICNRVLADRKCLNKHLKRHYETPEKSHQCDICKKTFTMYLSLKIHKASHVPENEKHIPCSECGKNFASKFLLSNHFRVVHLKKNIRICDVCGKAISCKEVFERHMLQHEGKPYTINCDICGLKLTSKNGLKRHKINMHPEGGKQEFSCSVCSKISPNLKALNKHIRYNHKWGYDHKCTICEKAFKTAQTLMEHMASHTGTVLYTCPWCPKTFNSNANFYSHRKKGHPKEWEEATRKKYSENMVPLLANTDIDLS